MSRWLTVAQRPQVRSVGPINNLTRQPVKGRKAGGGIRLGEMERDALLGESHMGGATTRRPSGCCCTSHTCRAGV
jgi:DNA-directed RNA polymerase beta subunit